MLLVTVTPGFTRPARAAPFVTLKPLLSLPAGTKVNFAGRAWMLLDPATGYLLMQDTLGGRAFDTNGHSAFNPNDPANIGHYLNNTFYNSLPAGDRPLAQNYNWTTGNETNEAASSVNCRIGLLSYSEYNAYSSLVTGSATFVLSDYWTRFPASSGASKTWAATLGQGPSGLHEYDATNGNVRVNPTVHLNPGLLLTVVEGQTATVVGGAYASVSVLDNCAAGVVVTGGGAYAPGDAVRLAAETATVTLDPIKLEFKFVPTGYNFWGWTDESGALVSASATYSFTMGASNRTLIGNFQKVPVVTVVNGLPFSVTVYNTNGALTGTYSGPYGTLTSVASGNNNVITGTLQGLSTTAPTSIAFGASLTAPTVDFRAVNPPSTTLDSSRSFY